VKEKKKKKRRRKDAIILDMQSDQGIDSFIARERISMTKRQL